MYNKDNIFAKIIRDEIFCETIYEDEYVMAFHDIKPAAPIHVLVIPKGNYKSFADFSSNAMISELTSFFQAIGKVAKKLGLEKNGYRVIMNHGKDALQSVEHFHAHILGGKNLGPLIEGTIHE